MQISPVVRFVVAMLFAAVVLGYFLIESEMPLALAAALWAFVIGGFGTYLFFRFFRPRK